MKWPLCKRIACLVFSLLLGAATTVAVAVFLATRPSPSLSWHAALNGRVHDYTYRICQESARGKSLRFIAITYYDDHGPATPRFSSDADDFVTSAAGHLHVEAAVPGPPGSTEVLGRPNPLEAAARRSLRWKAEDESFAESPLGKAVRDTWGALPPPLEYDEAGFAQSEAFGWPCVALWSGWGGKGSVLDSCDHFFVGEHWLRRPNGERYAVPTRPASPGFLFNTLSYAAPWWLVLITPGLIRRHHRRRNNRCPNCNYDLTGLPAPDPQASSPPTCPECGS